MVKLKRRKERRKRKRRKEMMKKKVERERKIRKRKENQGGHKIGNKSVSFCLFKPRCCFFTIMTSYFINVMRRHKIQTVFATFYIFF